MFSRSKFLLKIALRISIFTATPRSYAHLRKVSTQLEPFPEIVNRYFGSQSSGSDINMCENSPKNHMNVDEQEDDTGSSSDSDMDSFAPGASKHYRKTRLFLIEDMLDDHWILSTGRYIERYPIDPNSKNSVRSHIPLVIFSYSKPTPLTGETHLAAVSLSALDLLDLDPSVVEHPKFKDFVLGKWAPGYSAPLAHRYGGYQFGIWADQLGDGRAHLLGNFDDVYSRNNIYSEVQLKGSGLTPYSRNGDGRAVVRSSFREFLAAEFMHALGFRTSRCGAIVVGDEVVIRDKYYTGNPEFEKTAIVLRIAPSWFRFGSLDILTKNNEIDNLKFLIGDIIDAHYHDIDIKDRNCYLHFFSEIVRGTAEMIAQWQSIGFVHGVMNTDNMSIVSVTIDYGPFGFMEAYNPRFVPNSSDDQGMYSYENQPKVGYNNLKRLSKTLEPLLEADQVGLMENILEGYHPQFEHFYLMYFGKKLGLSHFHINDEEVIGLLLTIMRKTKSDFTMTFWELGNITISDLEARELPADFWALKKVVRHSKFPEFLEKYKMVLEARETTEDTRKSIMAEANPKYVLRNWIAQDTIDEYEKGDLNALDRTLKVFQNPFTHQTLAEYKGYAGKTPKQYENLKLSCSS